MLNDKFIKTASELSKTDNSDVIKVASLVRKLQNLWNSITDPKYRAMVEKLDENSKTTLFIGKRLNKSLEDLKGAINSGNVAEYTAALKLVQKQIELLSNELQDVERRTNNAFRHTLNQIPEVASNIKNELPEDFDLESKVDYDRPLRSFDWFKYKEPSINVTENALNALKTKIKESLNLEDVSEHFEGEKLNIFLNNFNKAIFDGLVKGKVRIRDDKRVIPVISNPFFVPGLDTRFVAKVLLADRSKSMYTGKPSLYYTLEILPLKKQVKDTSRKVEQKELPELDSEPFEKEEKSSESEFFPPENDELSQDKEKYNFPISGIIPKLPDSTSSKRIDILKKLASGNRLPYKVTSLGPVEFANVLAKGFEMAFGRPPTIEELGGGWAQATLENGMNPKLPNNNIGNIKATDGWVNSGNPYFIKGTIEFTSDGKKYKEEGTKWRAFNTPEEGAKSYWELIGGRYKQALNWMSSGDPESAAIALGLKGYYTASVKKYSGAMRLRYEHFLKNVAPQLSGLQSIPKPPPGKKPEIKDWVADYSKEEREEIFRNESATNVPKTQNAPAGFKPKDTPTDFATFVSDKMVDDLLTRLSTSPLTDLVKRSLLEKRKHQILISLAHNKSRTEQTEFARVLSSVLSNFYRLNTDICIGDNVEINCIASGNLNILQEGIQEVADLVASSMYKKTKIYISPIVVSGMLSKNNPVDSDYLISNRNKFLLKRLANG